MRTHTSLKNTYEATFNASANAGSPFVKILGIVLLALLGACSAKELRPGAERVIVTRQTPPEDCRSLGNVVGEQGGSLTGGWTSNKNLMIGAMNDLKNQAREMGGNYVLLEESKAGNTQSGNWYSSSGRQTDVTNMGTVFHCPESEMSTARTSRKAKKSKRSSRAAL